MREWKYSSTILDLDTRWKLNGQLHTPAALTPGKRPRCLWIREKSLVPARNRTPAVHAVARHYTDWAIVVRIFDLDYIQFVSSVTGIVSRNPAGTMVPWEEIWGKQKEKK
jgi:hypothetical protein